MLCSHKKLAGYYWPAMDVFESKKKSQTAGWTIFFLFSRYISRRARGQRSHTYRGYALTLRDVRNGKRSTSCLLVTGICRRNTSHSKTRRDAVILLKTENEYFSQNNWKLSPKIEILVVKREFDPPAFREASVKHLTHLHHAKCLAFYFCSKSLNKTCAAWITKNKKALICCFLTVPLYFLV